MPPKFQSTFIPKGPVASNTANVMPSMSSRPVKRSFVSFIAKLIFTISILLAAGAFAYKFYLNYSIESMGSELESMRQELSNGAVDELVDLNNRIVTTQDLIRRHRILSPLFEYLQVNTPQTVRFTDFSYTMADTGPLMTVKGEARSYGALAFAADIFNKNKNFKNPVFSDIRLDDKGNVTFTLQSNVLPALLSYEEDISKMPALNATTTTFTTIIATTTPVTASTTATSTQRTATSTRN